MPPARIQPKNPPSGADDIKPLERPDPVVPEPDSPNPIPGRVRPDIAMCSESAPMGAASPAPAPLPSIRPSSSRSAGSSETTQARNKRAATFAPAEPSAASAPTAATSRILSRLQPPKMSLSAPKLPSMPTMPKLPTPNSMLRSATSPGFLRRGVTKKLPDIKSFSIEVELPGGFTTSAGGTSLVVTYDIDAPHTLSWQLDVFEARSAGEAPDAEGSTSHSHLDGLKEGAPAVGAPAVGAPAVGAPASEGGGAGAPGQRAREMAPSPSMLRTHPTTRAPEEPALPNGSCLLYLYPKVTTSLERISPSTAGLQVLRQMLLALAAGTGAFEVADPVGAYPLHALVVCNTPESLDLSLEVYRRHPHWLAQVHAPSGPFYGESVLHICAVNKCETQLIQLVELASEHLSPADARELLKRQAEGPFFSTLPMRLYGSTALAYACCFDLREGVKAMLATGHVDLNDREDACKATGMMPIHAVVANSQVTRRRS